MDEDATSDFAATLRAFMAQTQRRPIDLERLTQISARTIENWCAGVVQRPRTIGDVLKVADALALTATEATQLLRAANHLPLLTLWTQAQRAGDADMLHSLEPWSSELKQMAGMAPVSVPKEPSSPIPPPAFPPDSTPAGLKLSDDLRGPREQERQLPDLGHLFAHYAGELREQPRLSGDGMLWPLGIPDDPYYPLPGRDRDLATLLDVLRDESGAKALVIDGLGGLGKTAIAAELARRALLGGYVEGVIGDSAKQEILSGGDILQIREATLDFDSLLDTLARQLGRWELPTLKPEEKRTALAHLLQRHRYLILVDNLETTENAHVLIAQLHGYLIQSRALITSRAQVRHDFVRSLSLQGLDLDDSLFFLRSDAAQHGLTQILQAPEARLHEIHVITGGAPLALKLVVAQTRHLDLELVLRRLQSAGSKLYPFIFRQSWETLSPEAQQILIYIGRTVVTTVGWEELSSVGIADNDDALVAAIEQLCSASLLNVSTVDGHMRYSIHQLTRQFINSDLPELWQEQGLI